MAIIYETTMTPGKLDLLAGWLPAQPWYLSTGRAPALAKAAGSGWMILRERSGSSSWW